MTTLACRPALPRDLPFIIGSWLESFRTSHAAGPIRMSEYHAVYEAEIQALLDREGVEVWVAYNPEEPDHGQELYGFLCLERGAQEPRRFTNERGHSEAGTHPVGQLVHFVYCKAHVRQLGIARAMAKAASIVPEQGGAYTFKTGTGTKVADRFKWRFNPLLPRFER